ncbi:IQ and ubiquitin-like domain-containing protein [Nilaparvata lugens]|uniref:IQ and ubiquitin-like domain-containing protein n=1 Tax=Nilaparvata lugens TaxID=108931 RepID=UPI00193D5978|nr:IQ and ubiquitin-like domain-containing protein [Nilaparvata lugens]XP_039290769.1 IQ and ubiquitin-like domain-containing protein [Nilaparvata lugens]
MSQVSLQPFTSSSSIKITKNEDSGQSMRGTLATYNDEELMEIPSLTNFEESVQNILDGDVKVKEQEIIEVNLEDEDSTMEILLEHETIPDPEITSKSSITESMMYYSQSYEGSERDLDRFMDRESLDLEEQVIPEEDEEEIEKVEVEIAFSSLNSESYEELENLAKTVEEKRMESMMVSTSSFATDEKGSLSYEQVGYNKESETDNVDGSNLIAVTCNVELENDKKHINTEEEQDIEKEHDRSADRVIKICEELGPILDLRVVIEGQEILRTSFGMNIPINNVKIRLAPIFHLKPDEIDLLHDGVICQDGDQLSHFQIAPPDSLILQVKPKDRDLNILTNDYLHYAPLIDIISARIPLSGSYFEDKLMQIESDCFVKEWLGGYKNNRTFKEYHHVQTQTLPRIYNLPPGVVLPPSFTRQTQTPVFPLVDEGTTSPESKATQVWRTDYYVANCSDKIIIANSKRFKPYVSNEHLSHLSLAMIVGTVMVFRRYMKCLLNRACRRAMECISLPRLDVTHQKMKDKIVKEVQRKMRINMFFPTTRFDFSMVYLLVSKWRHKETKLIDKLKTNESRKAAYCSLFKKEVDMIWRIEQQRLAVKKEALKRNNQEFLEKAARLKNTKKFVSIDSLETQQAREYMDVYSTLTRRDVTREQRLDFLHHFRNLILSICPEDGVDKLIQLVDRECDLLQIGLKHTQLEVLRLRIEQHTLEFFRNNLNKDDFDSYKERTLKKSVQAKFRCSRCRLLKPCSDFNVHLKVTRFSICYSCEWLMHIGYQRLDLSPYLRILESVRKSEMNLFTKSGASYILQVTGMYFLVNNIWLGKSALSEISDVSNLRMVRWRQNEDWTPWNCILLTQEESRIHMEIPNVDQYYAKPFLNSVYLKHKRAKYHFLLLYVSDMYIKKTGLWYNVI